MLIFQLIKKATEFSVAFFIKVDFSKNYNLKREIV